MDSRTGREVLPSARARVAPVSLAASLAVLIVLPLVVSACGTNVAVERIVVRGADDVQVLTPEQVAEQRRPAPATSTTSTTSVAQASQVTESNAAETNGSGAPGTPTSTQAADTVPQNVDTRPPEIKLFDAFGKFRGCLEERGYGIDGDLLDPNNPAYQDPDYVDAVSTCAARTDIVAILEEVQATRTSLTPEEVEQRNEVFTSLRDCLEGKGWTVETSTSAIGLLEPTVFRNADGVLDERDIDQCLTDQNLDG